MGGVNEQRGNGNRKVFVTASGNDACVLCGVDTGIPTPTPITDRKHYVRGIGQCCPGCILFAGGDQ